MAAAAARDQHGVMDRPQLRTEPPPGQAALCAGRTPRSGHAWHLSFTTRNREPLFREFNGGRAVSACLHAPAAIPGGQMLAWVVMPDHVHCLFELGEQQ